LEVVVGESGEDRV